MLSQHLQTIKCMMIRLNFNFINFIISKYLIIYHISHCIKVCLKMGSRITRALSVTDRNRRINPSNQA